MTHASSALISTPLVLQSAQWDPHTRVLSGTFPVDIGYEEKDQSAMWAFHRELLKPLLSFTAKEDLLLKLRPFGIESISELKVRPAIMDGKIFMNVAMNVTLTADQASKIQLFPNVKDQIVNHVIEALPFQAAANVGDEVRNWPNGKPWTQKIADRAKALLGIS